MRKVGLFKGLGLSLKSYGKAFDIIFSKGLWWFFIFPIILNAIFLISGWWAVGEAAAWVNEWLDGQINSITWLAFMKGFLHVVIAIVFKIFFIVIFAAIGGYIVIIMLSPVFSFLSEKTEKILTGKEYPFSADQLMRDIVRGVLIACRNMFIEFMWMILCFLFSFIPFIGFLSPFILYFVSSYFYGFSFMDYTIERRRLSITESTRFMRKNKGLPMGIGSVYALFLLIPYCGVSLAGFAAIVSVVAGTISVHELEQKHGEIVSTREAEA